MNIYLIEKPGIVDYDEYNAAVVFAENEEQARKIHPDGTIDFDNKEHHRGTWCKSKNVKVMLLGQALPNQTSGVILASFNAG